MVRTSKKESEAYKIVRSLKKAGLKGVDIARAIGCSPITVSRWSSNKNRAYRLHVEQLRELYRERLGRERW